MSSIPNSAMPHAKASDGQQSQNGAGQKDKGIAATATKAVTDGAGKIADLARDNPKTAIAAGVAVAGAIAAAVIPALRGGSEGSGGKKTASKSGSAKKSTAKA